MNFRLWLESTSMRVYRGVGPRGKEQMRPSDDGVLGPGIYFYDNQQDASAYATSGGGVVVAEIDPNDPEITITDPRPVHMVGSSFVLRHHRIIVVPDASKVRVVGFIPASEL